MAGAVFGRLAGAAAAEGALATGDAMRGSGG